MRIQNTARRLLIAAILVAVLTGAGAFHRSERALAGGVIGPRQMLGAYYSLINQRNFQAAYAQWTNPTQTYNDFVTGYNDTSSVQAYLGGFQPMVANAVEGYVPAYLVGYRYDGTVGTYKGCYQVLYNPAETGLRSWLISGANFWEIAGLPATGSQFLDVLNFDCTGTRGTSPANYPGVQSMLVDYYAAINGTNYGHAYNLWSPPRQTYEDFVAGFEDTVEVVMFYGSYQWGGGNTGRETGAVPVVLLGYHTDGSVVGFEGCFRVTFRPRPDLNWGILGADLRTLAVIPPDYNMVFAALSQSCYGPIAG